MNHPLSRRHALKTLGIGLAASTLAPQIGGRAYAAPPLSPQDPKGPFTLPPLPYPADALEPHIDAQTMSIHHGKHHAAYVAKLNDAVTAEPSLKGKTVEDLLRALDRVPEPVRATVRNNGGGHLNHSLFWESLSKEAGAPEAKLAAAIQAGFGGLDPLKEQMSKAALGVFGSGWVWLVQGADGKLALDTTPNQDNPITSGKIPLLGIDVWEHAYYLKYQNRRADYLAAIWNVIDWKTVGKRLAAETPGGRAARKRVYSP